jgi:probable HAF family extracellular repeat protein
MKRILISIATGSLLATLATAQTPRYTITDLGTLGGTVGSANGINYEGRVAGAASLADGNSRAFLSGPGVMYDLGTLGGPNSNEGGLNASNQVAIFADTSKKDPFGNDFCGFGTNLICQAAIWDGTMTALPTLGGNHSIAYAINNQGQVAGAAETSTKDSTCIAPQALRFEAALWGSAGQVQEPHRFPATPWERLSGSTTTVRWSAHRALARTAELLRPSMGRTPCSGKTACPLTSAIWGARWSTWANPSMTYAKLSGARI